MNKNLSKVVLGIVLLVAITFTGCKDDDPLSNLSGLVEFGFMAHDDIPGLENVKFTIDHTNFTIHNEEVLPYETDVTELVAVFEKIAFTTVSVGGEMQVSGSTVNDFSSPVNYVVTAEDGVTKVTYEVMVNVSDVNPEGVSWVKEQAAITGDAYQTVESVFFNGKHRAIFGSNGDVAVSKYYTSVDGVAWSETNVEAASFPLGSRQEMIVHDGNLYICGYYGYASPWGFPMKSTVTEIWKSTDGDTFEKLTSTYTFDGGKVNSALFSVDSKLWVVGGNTTGFGNPDGTKGVDSDFYGPAGLSMRIHNSSDMATWEEADTDVLPEGAERRYSANVVHGGKMFMIGGQIAGGILSSDVWSSADGKTWAKVTDAGFSARMGAAAISYDNKIWLFGGQTALGVCTSEILVSSDDGLTWEAVEEDAMLPAEFTPRAGHAAYLDASNKVWIVGGYASELKVETVDGEEVRSEIITSLGDAWGGKLNKLNN